MFKRIFVLIIFLTNFFSVFSANVFVDVDVYTDYTSFVYTFEFDLDESYRSFSFEKPKDANVEYVNSKNLDSVKYSIAGDYIIVNPDLVKNETFEIKFVSSSLSKDIFDKKSFEVYTNFNFVVEQLVFNLELIENLGEIESFFPRNYQILDDGRFSWKLNNIAREELFRLVFSEVYTLEEIQRDKFWTANKLIIVSSIVLFSTLIMLVLMFVFSNKFRLFHINFNFSFKSNKKSDKKNLKKPATKPKNSNEEIVEDESSQKISTDDIEILTQDDVRSDLSLENKINEEEYREVMAKFLTDNEKLVVSCVRENEGISQYDILNFLPKLTKSNLSKIITKLDNKKILKRIRVGKVNKIYLGSRFNLPKEETKSD